MGIYTKGGSVKAVVSDTSVNRGVYTTDGSMRITPVNGNTYVGRSAPDGSVNVVPANYDSLRGINHPSGAIRGYYLTSETAGSGMYHNSGAMNIYAGITADEILLLSDLGMVLNFTDNSYLLKT